MSEVYLSLIIPVYNETDRLIQGMMEIGAYLTKQRFSWELIVVDDGSDIPAEQILAFEKQKIQKMKKQGVIRIIRLPHNQGKGKAIQAGMRKVQGTFVVFTDVDCSVPMTFLSSILTALKTHDVAIASRRQRSSVIAVHQPKLREVAGQIYTFLANVLCGIAVTDATCGMKGYTKAVAQDIFAKSRISRWSFDAEVLFLARKYQYEITEVPVVWKNKQGSRVKFIDTLRSFMDLIMIRVNDVMRRYK